MKLVIYDANKIVEVIENVVNPRVNENSVEWEGGSLSGINLPFLLLDEDAQVFEEVTDQLISNDRKSEFLKVDLAKENADLKATQTLMQKALDDLILGGML
jgi:hypothetical protein